MDPIHPILPQKPNLPPVTEPPRVGRIDRRDPRERQEEQRHGKDDQVPQGHGAKRRDVEPWDADEAGPHIDITA